MLKDIIIGSDEKFSMDKKASTRRWNIFIPHLQNASLYCLGTTH